jgi:NAD(P)-dependent dehydrogenase (short-subunit alcohol dehydrogenase family)
VTAIGSNVTGVQGDVAKLADLDRLYETVGKVKGRIDIIFANAGVVNSFPLVKSGRSILTSSSTST